MSEKIIEVDGKRYMKVQKGKYFDKKKDKNKKMKRHHPIRWILISCFCLLVVAPVGFVFGAFYEPQTKNNIIQETDYINAYTESLAKGLVNMVYPTNPEDKGKFKVTIDENFFDGLLNVARKQLDNNPASNYIDKFYCYINGNNYEFVAEAHFSFFKTRIHIYTILEDTPEILRFKINKISLGRLPVNSIADAILPKFINDDTLNDIFKKANINAVFSLKNKEITYKRSDLRTDLGKYIEDMLGESGSTVGSIIFSLWDNLTESGISFKDGVSLKLDLTNLLTRKDEKYLDNKTTTESRVPGYIKFAEEQVNKANIKSEQVDDLMDYLIQGYSTSEGSSSYKLFKDNTKLQNDVNKYLTTLGLQSDEKYNEYKGDYEKDSTKTGKGWRDNHAEDIGTIINDGTESKYPESKFKKPQLKDVTDFLNDTTKSLEFLTLSDKLISDSMRSNEINFLGSMLGTSITLDNKIYVPTISFTDFCTQLYKIAGDSKNYLAIDADIDLYGLTMPLRLHGELVSGYRSIDFKIDNNKAYLGQVQFNNDSLKFLYEFIKDAVKKDSKLNFEYDTKLDAKFTYNIKNFECTISETPINTLVNNILNGEDKECVFDPEGAKISYNPSKFNIGLTTDFTTYSEKRVVNVSLTHNQ